MFGSETFEDKYVAFLHQFHASLEVWKRFVNFVHQPLEEYNTVEKLPECQGSVQTLPSARFWEFSFLQIVFSPFLFLWRAEVEECCRNGAKR